MLTSATLALVLTAPPAAPDAPDVKQRVRSGLKWLAAQQKPEGYWVGNNDGFPTLSTSFAGLALLMEGSTLRRGEYAPQLRKAVAYLEKKVGADGRIGGWHPTEAGRDLYDHAAATLFLVCAYDTDDDEQRRERLAKQIDRALAFLTDRPAARGGWNFRSTDRSFSDPYSTVTVLQALLAARKAGFDVPRKVTDGAIRYLVKATRYDGTLDFTNPDRNITLETDPALMAGAAAVVMMHDGRRPDALAGWVKFVKAQASPVMQNLATNPIALFQQYDVARAAFALGDGGHRRIEPGVKDPELVTWDRYKAAAFKPLAEAQAEDGGWPEGFFGRVHTSALVLIVLQLDNGYLPAFAR